VSKITIPPHYLAALSSFDPEATDSAVHVRLPELLVLISNRKTSKESPLAHTCSSSFALWKLSPSRRGRAISCARTLEKDQSTSPGSPCKGLSVVKSSAERYVPHETSTSLNRAWNRELWCKIFSTLLTDDTEGSADFVRNSLRGLEREIAEFVSLMKPSHVMVPRSTLRH
jgi:hypothetical protein